MKVSGIERVTLTQTIALVGYTGFVVSNIYAHAGQKIGMVYNSKRIFG